MENESFTVCWAIIHLIKRRVLSVIEKLKCMLAARTDLLKSLILLPINSICHCQKLSSKQVIQTLFKLFFFPFDIILLSLLRLVGQISKSNSTQPFFESESFSHRVIQIHYASSRPKWASCIPAVYWEWSLALANSRTDPMNWLRHCQLYKSKLSDSKKCCRICMSEFQSPVTFPGTTEFISVHKAIML